MVGQETVVIKPSRSDEVLDPDLQLQITNKVRAQFDSIVPKRPSKPNRSDPDDFTPSDPLNFPYTVSTTCNPELDKLQSLRSQGVFSCCSNSTVAEDEFSETQYYKELDSIDKQHHTTGSGFIKVVSENEEINGCKDLEIERGIVNGGGYSNRHLIICKSNPATNDWIPSLDDGQVGYGSSKPNRSENC